MIKINKINIVLTKYIELTINFFSYKVIIKREKRLYQAKFRYNIRVFKDNILIYKK